MDEYTLYAAFRRSRRLWAWDLRDTSLPVCCFEPECSARSEEGSNAVRRDATEDVTENLTNQKTRFDIDRGGRWMGTGDQVSSPLGLRNLLETGVIHGIRWGTSQCTTFILEIRLAAWMRVLATVQAAEKTFL